MAAPPPIAPSSRPRPVYHNIQLTDLARYRLPLPGIVSILHRIIMNCVDVCPKGLNPSKAIGKIKEIMVRRAV